MNQQVGVQRRGMQRRFPLLGFFIWSSAFAGIFYLCYQNNENIKAFSFQSEVDLNKANKLIVKRFEKIEEKINLVGDESEKLVSVLKEMSVSLKNMEMQIAKATTSSDIFELISQMSKSNSNKIEKALADFGKRADLQKCQKLLINLVE